jgi:hypothetical protein
VVKVGRVTSFPHEKLWDRESTRKNKIHHIHHIFSFDALGVPASRGPTAHGQQAGWELLGTGQQDVILPYQRRLTTWVRCSQYNSSLYVFFEKKAG